MAATSTQFGNLQKRHCVVEGSVARELLDEAGFLRLQATGWWSWSDSNQPPECYGMWAVSDQLTRSDTRPRARRGPLLMGISIKGNLGCRHAAREVPVFPARRQPSSPQTAPPLGALPLLLRQPPTTGEVAVG